MTEHKSRVFTFEDVEVREREFSVVKDGEVLGVEPKAFHVLLFMLRNPRKVISKDELLEAVWSDASVSENSLTRTVAQLRRILGDDIREPRYIATVPTVGYRFLCDVQVTEDGYARLDRGDSYRPPVIDTSILARAEEQQEQRSESSRKKLSGLSLAGLCALALGIVVAGFLVRRTVSKHDVPGSALAHLATEQRITSNPPEAPVTHAVVSPDGKYLAYADPTGLYLRQINSGETRLWSLPKDFVAWPASWFPDSTHLLVARLEGEGRMPGLDWKPSLWKLSLLGGNPQKLMDDAGGGAVSPDGTRIAYLPGPEFGSELWVMDSDGGNARKIAWPRNKISQPREEGGSTPWSGHRAGSALRISNAIVIPHPRRQAILSHWTLATRMVVIYRLY
jgi:DNA-binding winged helix-turn-helix (wHTH) protein